MPKVGMFKLLQATLSTTGFGSSDSIVTVAVMLIF